MDRKAFLKLASAGVLSSASLGMISGCATYRYVDAVRSGNQLKVLRSNFGDDPFIMVRHPEVKSPIYLGKDPEDSYLAILLECTHKQCTVNPAGNQFACPCHGSKYDPEGKVLEGPARRDLQKFPVTADSDSIYIQLQ